MSDADEDNRWQPHPSRDRREALHLCSWHLDVFLSVRCRFGGAVEAGIDHNEHCTRHGTVLRRMHWRYCSDRN
jgi:hypothetical protein